MASQGNRIRHGVGQLVTVRAKNALRKYKYKVKFGAVTISGEKPNDDVVIANVKRSTELLSG